MSSIKPRQGIQFKMTSVVHVQVEPIFTLPWRRFPLKEVNDCITQKSILFSFVVFSLPPHQQTAFCFCAAFHLFVYYCIPGTCNNTSFYVYSNTPLRQLIIFSRHQRPMQTRSAVRRLLHRGSVCAFGGKKTHCVYVLLEYNDSAMNLCRAELWWSDTAAQILYNTDSYCTEGNR